MKSNNPVLLVLGPPPESWFEALGEVRQQVQTRVASNAEECKTLLPGAEIVFVWEKSWKWLAPNWPQGRAVKWVQSGSAGVENLLFPDMANSSVVLTNGRGLYAEPLAEFVLFCALFFAKKFPEMEKNRLARKWKEYQPAELAGKTMGIVGFGGTGRAVARLAKAFRMRVAATKRRINQDLEPGLVDQLLPPERWHELLATSDYVVNALPITPDTQGFFDEPAFRAMKPSATFINVGRGETVDEPALIRALREGWIAGAGLDVFAKEPLPGESGLYELSNVIFSPHCADLTPSYPEQSGRLLRENLERYLDGRPLRNIVDKKRGY